MSVTAASHTMSAYVQGVLGLLNFETGTETLTEIEFAVVFLVLLVITNWKSKGDTLD